MLSWKHFNVFMGAVVHIYDFIPYFNVSFIFFCHANENTQPTIPSFCNDEGLTSSKCQLPYLFIEEMLPKSTSFILNCNKKKGFTGNFCTTVHLHCNSLEIWPRLDFYRAQKKCILPSRLNHKVPLWWECS